MKRLSPCRVLSNHEQAVVDTLSSSANNLDAICELTGLSAGQVSAAVLTLTLDGLLLESADGFYHLARQQQQR